EARTRDKAVAIDEVKRRAIRRAQRAGADVEVLLSVQVAPRAEQAREQKGAGQSRHRPGARQAQLRSTPACDFPVAELHTIQSGQGAGRRLERSLNRTIL